MYATELNFYLLLLHTVDELVLEALQALMCKYILKKYTVVYFRT